MSAKKFMLVIGVLVVGAIGFVAFKPSSKQAEQVRPGIAHKNEGREHVQAKQYGGDEPPTSGPHAEEASWGDHEQEIPDVNAIHNLEHGGIYISYRPDLAKDQVAKIKALFIKPFSDSAFKPTKIVIAPRANNKSPIVLSSWDRSQKFTKFDQQAMINYYLKNVGKSPEPGAL